MCVCERVQLFCKKCYIQMKFLPERSLHDLLNAEVSSWRYSQLFYLHVSLMHGHGLAYPWLNYLIKGQLVFVSEQSVDLHQTVFPFLRPHFVHG